VTESATPTDESGDEELESDPMLDEDGSSPALDERRPRPSWQRLNISIGALAMLLTVGVGYLKYELSVDAQLGTAHQQATQIAKDSTVAMLSYTSADAARTLNAAGDRLTGSFKDSYASLIRDVVIPGSVQKQIAATASVTAAAASSVSATHAVVVVFVD
jgi:Mce-associated membrane protein